MHKQVGRISSFDHRLTVIPPGRYLVKPRKFSEKGSMFKHTPFAIWAIEYQKYEMNFKVKMEWDRWKMSPWLTQQHFLMTKGLFVIILSKDQVAPVTGIKHCNSITVPN